MSIPTYPHYQETEFSTLGSIPTHWTVQRLKRAASVSASNVDKKTYEGQQSVRLCNYTDVYYNDVITGDMPFMAATATNEQIERFLLKSGDTIITKDSESANDIAVAAYVPSDLPGVVCGYHLSIVRPLSTTNGAFLKRYFDSHFARTWFEVRANGLTRMGLGQYAIENAPIPIPPTHEQRGIATFLDRETAKIDALVEEQQRLIALLDEKRQAVISHAVTKGLDPDVPMKESGIEWLGEVPAHWEVIALSRLVDPRRPITYGIVQPGEADPEGRFMVRGQDYSKGWASPEAIFRVSDAVEQPYRRARLTPGDVVITIVGAGTGNTAVVPAFLDGANITQTTARVAPLAGMVDGAYLARALGSWIGRTQVALFQKGAAQPGLNLEHLKGFRFPTPPLEEQEEIAAAVAEQLFDFEELRADATKATQLLQERREALVSAAVTGKIDVRGLVADQAEAA
jgi:type I restriction enzyme, S subunit